MHAYTLVAPLRDKRAQARAKLGAGGSIGTDAGLETLVRLWRKRYMNGATDTSSQVSRPVAANSAPGVCRSAGRTLFSPSITSCQVAKKAAF